MSNLDTRLEEIKQRLEKLTPLPFKEPPIVFIQFDENNGPTEGSVIWNEYLRFGFSSQNDITLLLKLIQVYQEALVTIECGLVTSESTAKFAGLRPNQVAHSALTTAEAIARGKE